MDKVSKQIKHTFGTREFIKCTPEELEEFVEQEISQALATQREEFRKMKSKRQWFKKMKKKYPDRFAPMYYLFVDWGIL